MFVRSMCDDMLARMPARNRSHASGATLRSRRLTHVRLATDAEDIGWLARTRGVDVPLHRTAEVPHADPPSLPVAQHALACLHRHEAREPAVVVFFKPTSRPRARQAIEAA